MLLSEASLADSDVLTLAQRVDLVLDPEFEQLFPGAVPARVVIETRTGRLHKTIMAPLGEPTNPLDWAALMRKYEAIAAHVLSPARSSALAQAIARLAGGDVAPLVEALSDPLVFTPANTRHALASESPLV